MLNAIIGTKQTMSQAFSEGERTPVTFIKAGPCVVTHIKTKDKDGYWAVQIGFGEKKTKNTTKPLKGHLKGAADGKTAPRLLREVKFSDKPEVKVGDIFKLEDVFSVGDVVSVSGVSKGKGFAGVVKRWGFAGGPKTHGQSDRHRAPGSIGQGTDPGRVWKGKKMAGRMGTGMTHVANLRIISIDEEKGLLGVSGPIPGSKNSILLIKLTKKSEKKIDANKEQKVETKKKDTEVNKENKSSEKENQDKKETKTKE